MYAINKFAPEKKIYLTIHEKQGYKNFEDTIIPDDLKIFSFKDHWSEDLNLERVLDFLGRRNFESADLHGYVFTYLDKNLTTSELKFF